MLEVEVLLLHYDNVKLQSEEERRSGRRYFRDVAVLVCFFSSFPLRLPSCSFWKQAILIPNRFTLNTIHLSCYCYHYSPHLNYRSPLDIHLHHFLDTRYYFLLHFHFPDHHFSAGLFRCFLHSLISFRYCFLFLFLFFLFFRSLFLLHFHFPAHHFPAGHFPCFLHSLLDFRHCFLLHFLHFLLLRSLRPLLVLLPVPVQVLVLHIVLAVLALVVCLLYKALNRWK